MIEQECQGDDHVRSSIQLNYPVAGRMSRPTNGNRGPTEMDVRRTGYIADIYNKASYISEQDHLLQQGKLLVAKAHLWTPDEAQIRFDAMMEIADPNHTSWIGFRRIGVPQGQYNGFFWQTEIGIPIHGGSMRLLWMLIRAFEPEAQGHHLGRKGMTLSLIAHPDATDIGHRSGSDAAILSWLMADVFKQNSRAPYDIPFNRVAKYAIALPLVYDLTHIYGERPDRATGVSRNEYLTPNRAYVPRPGHRPTELIHDWRIRSIEEGGLGMGPNDGLFEFGELK